VRIVTPFAADLRETPQQTTLLGMWPLTSVDDITEGSTCTLDNVAGKNARWGDHAPDPGTGGVAPYRIYNISNEQPVGLLRYIDVADALALIVNVVSRPAVSLAEGMANFVQWYRDQYAGQDDAHG